MCRSFDDVVVVALGYRRLSHAGDWPLRTEYPLRAVERIRLRVACICFLIIGICFLPQRAQRTQRILGQGYSDYRWLSRALDLAERLC